MAKHKITFSPAEVELEPGESKQIEVGLTKAEEVECPIPPEGSLIQVKGNPPVYWMQEGKARWVTTGQVLEEMAKDPEVAKGDPDWKDKRRWVKEECLEQGKPPVGDPIEKWPEEEEHKITYRGFMISGSGAPSVTELKNAGINLIFDKDAEQIAGMTVFNWGNMINQIKPEGYPKQVMMNGEEVGSICPYAGKEFFYRFSKEVFDYVRREGIAGFVGDGDRYVQQRGSDGKWYEGGYCQQCREAGGYGFESSQKAMDFKNAAIEEVNRIFKVEACSKKMGAFLWQGNIVDGQVVFAGMVGVGRPKTLGGILDFSIPMIYNNFGEFKVLAEAWRKEVPNDRLILALCWSASDAPLNESLLIEKIKYCEEHKFNWCVAGNSYKREQLEAIKKARRELTMISKNSKCYNWAGDIIVRDTLVPNKRAVVGYKDRSIPTDIREWIKEPPNNKLSEALLEIPNLPERKEAGSFNQRAMLIWEYVAEKITYVYDKQAHGLPDFWMLPEEVLTLKKGDCEDSTYLLCSLLLASGVSPFCVRAVLGIVYDKKGDPLGGHAWPVYLDELGKWRLLESTLDTIPATMPLADSLAKEGTEFRYEPTLCFNRQHLWLVKPSTMNISKYLTINKVKADEGR